MGAYLPGRAFRRAAQVVAATDHRRGLKMNIAQEIDQQRIDPSGTDIETDARIGNLGAQGHFGRGIGGECRGDHVVDR